jgi:branched-chain amino acid transport system ATP-binding protein
MHNGDTRSSAVEALRRAQPRGTDQAPILEVERLSLAFGGVAALRDVTVSIASGTISSIIGPNGSGKTTLFNCISRIYQPDRGRIRFKGRDLLALRPHQVAARGIGRTFQNPELFSRMTTLENLLLGRHLHVGTGLLGAAARSRRAVREEVTHRRQVERIIEFLGLQAARHRPVAGLPYGTRKLVEIGRALALEPELLLLDEPSAGMSADEKGDLALWIEDIRDELGITVLLVEHDMGLVMRISDTVVALNDGEKIAEGPPEAIQRHPEVLRAYLGDREPVAC